MVNVDFSKTFRALTGHSPFNWQTRLCKEFKQGKIPKRCSLPTGLGKTSVIPIWLIALASKSPTSVPRRLIYIVNRRTVVDQATDDAKRLLARLYQSARQEKLSWATADAIEQHGLSGEPPLLEEHAPAVKVLTDALLGISGDGDTAPLAVSTLRGELADDGEWRRDPARPAIIIGTVDMIGSKLLFSGYGDGRYGRAHHAGLVGQDALIIHDEAHLTPAFSKLLWTVHQEQQREETRASSQPGDAAVATRPIRVMELSATTRRDDDHANEAFGIADEDEDPIVDRRVFASKTLRFDKENAKSKLPAQIAEAATNKHDGKNCRVLVYVQLPKNAEAVYEAIRKKLKLTDAEAGERIRLLTGTIRGFERDELAESKLFKAFKSDPNRPAQLDQTLYLVSTSAGEVGVDLDADHLVCDVTPVDSMAQRFGRVNRLGGKHRHADITVVSEKESKSDTKKKEKKHSPFDAAVAVTEEILRKIADNGGDVSPNALGTVLESDEARDAFSPTPTILPATDILFDAWSLTSIDGTFPGRPGVEPYLHGVAEYDPPDTYVAWRHEIPDLDKATERKAIAEADLNRIFSKFPIRSVEKVRCRTDLFLEELVKIAKRLKREKIAKEHPDARAVLLTRDGAKWIKLSEFQEIDKKDPRARRRFENAQLVLPCEVGGLKSGFLDGDSEEPVWDVAEECAKGQRARQRVRIIGDANKAVVDGKKLIKGLSTVLELPLDDDEFRAEDDQPERIEYRVARAEAGEPGRNVPLSEHVLKVKGAAGRIARAVGLSDTLQSALVLAARHHDAGKARPRWQSFAGNDAMDTPLLAKSAKRTHWRVLGGFRHEFASLLDARGVVDITDHAERDLILHLIAAHHGRARPHFERDAFDREESTTTRDRDVAIEVVRRFDQLQQRFGRWSLAWLETLLRCADQIGSQATVGNGKDTEGNQ